jgi:hypothetical protein
MQEKQCFKCKEIKPIAEFRQYKSGVNKGYYHSSCKSCMRKDLKQYGKTPWGRVCKRITRRCGVSGKYRKRGIRKYISSLEIKRLWFRDRAWLLKWPSIDRIDTNGNYTFKNCRFIEFKENCSRKRNIK